MTCTLHWFFNPTVYVNKHFSCLTYGRVPTKGRNYVGTRNLCIMIAFCWISIRKKKYTGKGPQTIASVSINQDLLIHHLNLKFAIKIWRKNTFGQIFKISFNDFESQITFKKYSLCLCKLLSLIIEEFVISGFFFQFITLKTFVISNLIRYFKF